MSAPDREFLVVYGTDGADVSPLSHLAVMMWPMGRATLCGLRAGSSDGAVDGLTLCPDCQTIALGCAA